MLRGTLGSLSSMLHKACSQDDPSAALRSVEATQHALGPTALQLTRQRESNGASQAHIAMKTASASVQQVSQRLESDASLGAACTAAGILMALESQADPSSAVFGPLRRLCVDALAVLASEAQQHSGPAQLACSVAGSCILSGPWIACIQTTVSAWKELRRLASNALLAVLLESCLHQVPAVGSLSSFAHRARAAHGACISAAVGIGALQACAHPLQAFASAAAAQADSEQQHQQRGADSRAAGLWRAQQVVMPICWQIMATLNNRAAFTARGEDPQIASLVADLMLVCALLHDREAASQPPHLRSLLAAAQAKLQHSAAAGSALLARVPYRYGGAPDVPTGQAASGGWRGTSAPSVLGAPDRAQLSDERFASCAQFLLVMAAPCLQHAASPHCASDQQCSFTHRQCAELLLPTLEQLLFTESAGKQQQQAIAAARAAGTDAALTLLGCVDSMQLEVFAVRWMHAFAAAVPQYSSVADLQAALHSIAIAAVPARCVLCCCHYVAERAAALQHGSCTKFGAGERGADVGGIEDVQGSTAAGMVGSLMAVVVWGPLSVFQEVLKQVERVWAAGNAAQRAEVASVVMRHLLSCHDHCRKPYCVRWYHACMVPRSQARPKL